MNKVWDILFGLGLIASAITAMLALSADSATSGAAGMLLPLAAVLTIGAFVQRRRAASAPGIGLLKPGKHTHVSKEEFTAKTALLVNSLMDAKAAPGGKQSPEYIVGHEITRLMEQWKAARKAPHLTGAELKSLYQLRQYALADVTDSQRLAFLDGVADPAPFVALRAKVETINANRQSSQASHAAWLASVGNTDMNHLLTAGWLAFLQGQPTPDPALWHAVATDFHDIDRRGRLDAAFWILTQPECDRATASDFIRGFVANERLELAARAGDKALIDAFHNVIRRYNAGAYAWFGIQPDLNDIEPIAETIAGPFDTAAVGAMMDRIAVATRTRPLTKPVGLLARTDTPSNPMPNAPASVYGFDSDTGLHLRYPGANWRQTAGARP